MIKFKELLVVEKMSVSLRDYDEIHSEFLNYSEITSSRVKRKLTSKTIWSCSKETNGFYQNESFYNHKY